MLVDNLTQPFPGDVSVDLGCGNVGVAQHDLYAAQIRPALHQLCGETVPQYVRRQIAKNARGFTMARKQFPECLPGHRGPARGHKKEPASAALK